MGEAKRRTLSGDMPKPKVDIVAKEQPPSSRRVLIAGGGSGSGMMMAVFSLINECPKLPK